MRFFFLLVFLLRLSIQRINSRFIFCSIFLLWSRSAQWQNEGIIWFRSNPYTQVFYSQCNYICTSPAVQGAALVSCCVLFPSFLLVSPSADPSGGCHVKNVVLRKGCGGGLAPSFWQFKIYFSVEGLHFVRELEQGFRCGPPNPVHPPLPPTPPATCKVHKVRESAGLRILNAKDCHPGASGDCRSSRRAVSVQRAAHVTPKPQQSLRKEEKAVKQESPTEWRILFPFLPMLIHFS